LKRKQSRHSIEIENWFEKSVYRLSLGKSSSKRF